MVNSNSNEILCSYTISEHKQTGILIAEKQIVLPEKELAMPDQSHGKVWGTTNSIIPTDSVFSLKGGRSL